MDRRYLQPYSDIATEMSITGPGEWLRPYIDEAASVVLGPKGMELREDGLVFLLTNLGGMIVIPWERGNNASFQGSQANVKMLVSDINRILDLATAAASLEDRKDISANMLLQATAFYGEGLAVRGLNLWGPTDG